MLDGRASQQTNSIDRLTIIDWFPEQVIQIDPFDRFLRFEI